MVLWSIDWPCTKKCSPETSISLHWSLPKADLERVLPSGIVPMRSWLVYKLLQRDTLELDMKSNRAKANQELLFHGRSSFRSLLWALCLQWFDMTCYPYPWRGLAGRQNIASNGGKWSQIDSKLQDSWRLKALGLLCSDRALCKSQEQRFLPIFAHVVLWARFALCPLS